MCKNAPIQVDGINVRTKKYYVAVGTKPMPNWQAITEREMISYPQKTNTKGDNPSP